MDLGITAAADHAARADGRFAEKARRLKVTKPFRWWMMLNARTAPIPLEVEDIGYRVIGCGQTVHKILGPGFKEVIYQRAFCLELDAQGLGFEC
jgi:hypothetical protein